MHKYDYGSNSWKQIPGAAVRFTLSRDGQPYVVRSNGDILKREPGGRWNTLPGKATDIAAGVNINGVGLWIIGKTPMPGGFSVHKLVGNSWQQVPGVGGLRIAVDADGNPWIVNNQGHILRYEDGTFKRMPGSATDVTVGKDGFVYVIGRTVMPWGGFSIHRWQGNLWTQIPGAGVGIAAFNASRGPAIINNQKKVQVWGP